MDKWDYMKLKSFCRKKEMVSNQNIKGTKKTKFPQNQ
jgi:hypothetical protein